MDGQNKNFWCGSNAPVPVARVFAGSCKKDVCELMPECLGGAWDINTMRNSFELLTDNSGLYCQGTTLRVFEVKFVCAQNIR
jgi:hypothetical protein